MYEIQRIKALSLARVVMLLTSVLYVLLGLLVTLLYGGIRSIVLGGILSNSVSALSFLSIWIGGLVLVLPLSWLTGLVSAALYNLFARWWGGIHIGLVRAESDEREKPVVKKGVKKGTENASNDKE